MKHLLFLLPALVATGAFASDLPHLEEKQHAVRSVEAREARMIELSDEIWRYAEPALREMKSSKALADWAEELGFRVERGVASMPTAFVAEYGSGSPVIGIMGEFDALPGISQKPQATKEPFEAGGGGHGCGHNLFGVGSLGAAAAIKDLIESGELKGTIRFFGTPAEEAVGGKIYMMRDGVMDGVDVMLAWHPSDEITSDTSSSQALVDLMVEFRGRSAHAAYDPWNGRSASDGLEIFTHAVNLMREHIPPTARMHYAIVEAGNVPNVVPDYAKIWIWLRDTERDGVEEMLGRLRKITDGAGLAADVGAELSILGGDWNMLANMAGQRIAWKNLEWLGPLQFTEEEQEFARTIQRETGVPEKGLLTELAPFNENPGPPEGGSTDVADISWNVPTLHISVTTAATGAPWHGWPVVATGGMSIGHKGMMHAAKALAATMVDLFEDPENVRRIREEFDASTKDVEYVPYIPAGPPQLPPSKS